MPAKRTNPFIAVLCLSALFSNCQTIPKNALVLNEQSLQWRSMQSRRFDTNDEKRILVVCANLLQDLGFTLEESETELGLVVGSKDRSAVEAGQMMGAFFVALLTGAVTPVDETQKLRASVVTRPFGENKESIIVRVTFQRVVWNSYGQITKRQRLNKPEFYQEFFDKLSKAVFLDAHEI